MNQTLIFFQRLSLLILVSLFSFTNCASSPETNEKSSEQEGSFLDKAVEKANSPEGRKAIEMAKEKAQDPATQDKVKGMMSKEKK